MLPNESKNDDIYNITIAQLKKITPYLNHIKLTPKQRKYCYFYVMNGFNGVDACRKAGYKTKKLDRESLIFAVQSSQNLKKPYICSAIKLIIDKTVENKKWLEKTLFEMFVTQATYDPSMFFNLDGTVKYSDWKDIPEKYRCCVESLEVKYFGKECQKRVVVLKLIDRKWAQDRLAKYIEIMNDANIGVGLTNETIDELRSIFDEYRGEVTGGKNNKEE